MLYVSAMIVLGVIVTRFVDREWLRQIVDSAGILGIGVFLVIEYIYVVLVPVYNTMIHLAAGYVFGGSTGWVLNFVATSAGLFTIVLLVKRFGRPIVERVVARRVLDRYDAVSRRIGPIALFLIYVLPLFPDDEFTYLIAASQVRFGRFVLPVLLGNVTKAAVSYIGDEGTGGIPMAAGSRLVVLVVGIVVIGLQETQWLSHRLLVMARIVRRIPGQWLLSLYCKRTFV